MNIYVGNLPFATSEEELEQLFSQFGSVDRASVITDRETGRSRGFGFVEMGDDDASQKAIDALNDTEYEGRSLTVNEARPRSNSGGGGGGGGGRRGGSNGYRGRGGGGGRDRR